MCRKIHIIPDYNNVEGICMSSLNFKNKTELQKAKFRKKTCFNEYTKQMLKSNFIRKGKTDEVPYCSKNIVSNYLNESETSFYYNVLN